MILLAYLAIFLVVMFIRRRGLVGSFLKAKLPADGKDYLEHLAYRGKRRTHVTPSVGVFLRDHFFFSISPEKPYHRLLKSLGLAYEIQTGDAELDKKYFFAADTPDEAQAIMQSENFRRSASLLLKGLSVRGLRAYGDKLWVKCATIPSTNYTPSMTEHYLGPLRAIAAELNAAAQQRAMTGDQGFFTPARIAIAFMLVHAGLLFTGVFGAPLFFFDKIKIVDVWQWVFYAGGVAALAGGLWVFFMLALLRYSSWLPMVVCDFVLMGIVGLSLSSGLLTREINIRFDRSPEKIHEQPIVERKCALICSSGSGKRTHSTTYPLTPEQCLPQTREQTLAQRGGCSRGKRLAYTLAVPPWAEGGKKNFTFDVGSGLYDRARLNSLVAVPSHAGALGLEWVDTAKITPR